MRSSYFAARHRCWRKNENFKGKLSCARSCKQAVSNLGGAGELAWGDNPGGGSLSGEHARRIVCCTCRRLCGLSSGLRARHCKPQLLVPPGSRRGKKLRKHIVPTRVTTLDEYFKAAGWRDVLFLKVGPLCCRMCCDIDSVWGFHAFVSSEDNGAKHRAL